MRVRRKAAPPLAARKMARDPAVLPNSTYCEAWTPAVSTSGIVRVRPFFRSSSA